jgi:rod shape-determining protein MreC
MVSIALMLWDYHHEHAAIKLRHTLSMVITPIVYTTNSPFALFDTVAKNLQSREELMRQNTTLQAQMLLLQGQVQKQQALQAENQQLRALLQSTPAINHVRLLVAQVLAIQANPYQQEILLNQGSQSGVFVGQAVLDAHGIMGQVIEVDTQTSRVLLLTDPSSAIPIQNNRTGMHGILNGQGNSGLLLWVNVSPTADVHVGDVLTSSGLGGHYPVGYPVGVVTSVNSHTDDQFLQVEVAPSAQMNSNEQVLLVWPNSRAAS